MAPPGLRVAAVQVLFQLVLAELWAYRTNVQTDEVGQSKCEGILLYPTVEKELDLRYEIKGHRIGIRMINLNQDWKGIHQSLLKMVA